MAMLLCYDYHKHGMSAGCRVTEQWMCSCNNWRLIFSDSIELHLMLCICDSGNVYKCRDLLVAQHPSRSNCRIIIKMLSI